MKAALYSLLILFTLVTTAAAQPDDKPVSISISNATRICCAAVSDRRVWTMRRGPAAHEMTFVFQGGEVQIVNDETLLPIRTVPAEQSKNYAVSSDQRFVSWLSPMSKQTVVRNVQTRKSVEFDAALK